MSDDEDPFEKLGGDAEDREGDPFEKLGTEDDGDGSEDAASDGDRSEEATPASHADRREAEPGGEDPSEESDFERENDPSPSPTGGLADDDRDFESLEPDDADSGGHDPWEQLQPEEESTASTGSGPESTGSGTNADAAEPAESDPEGEFEFERELEPEGESSLGDVGTREGDPFESMGSFEDRSVEGVDPDVVWQDLAGAEARGSVSAGRKRSYADVSKHSYCEQCEHFSPPPDVHCTHEGTEIVEFRDMETVRLVDCPVVAERKQLEERD